MPVRSVCWQAPGRVNLIGEHTDYNEGLALPFALEQCCRARVAEREPSRSESLLVRTTLRREPVEIPLEALSPGLRLAETGAWAAYPAGVVGALRQRGVDVPGLVVELDSAVPTGAGLSSSAAVICAVACAVDDLLGLGLSRADLLAVTRSAENDFVGVPTGGMDQLASLSGVAGHALLCDLRELTAEPVPFDPAAHGLGLLVVDTRAPHRNSDSDYRHRREGCRRAAELLGVTALRDVMPEALTDALARLPDGELRRLVRHVVTENERVTLTADLLRSGDLAGIGPLLDASHSSLREDYRVTVPQVDTAVETLTAAGPLGARMTGGGFGGCVIALTPSELVESAAAAVRLEFARRGFAPPTHFVARASQGARRVD